jgi:hypothetical protein
MEKPVKGDVIVVPFPYSDLSNMKNRPALVAANLEGEDIFHALTTEGHARSIDTIAQRQLPHEAS